MARTISGKLTGKAASTERQDQAEDIFYGKVHALRTELAQERDDLTEKLQQLDPEGWAAWWDSDAMPAYGWLPQIEALKKRIAELEGRLQDHSDVLLGKKYGNPL